MKYFENWNMTSLVCYNQVIKYKTHFETRKLKFTPLLSIPNFRNFQTPGISEVRQFKK